MFWKHNKILLFSLLIVGLGLLSFSKKSSHRKPGSEHAYIDFSASHDTWADSILKGMTLEEKIGQMFMVAAYSNKDQKHVNEILDLIQNQKIGGLIFFQGGPVREAQLTNLYQSKSKIPLLISIDGEWGLAMRLDSTIQYPRQMMLGAVQNNKLIYEMGCDIADQCRRLGIHINFAPVLDINNNALNPVINSRSFGEQRDNVTRKGLEYMHGLQDGQVIANGKHFPGHGDTDSDSHKTLPTVKRSKTELEALELYPFKALINAGIGSIMVAHLSVPCLDTAKNCASTLSKTIVTDLLKKELKFKGLVFTDALNMKGVSGYFKPGEVDLRAFIAGNDVLLFPEDVPTAIQKIKEAVDSNLVSVDEINSRCRKILLAKKWSGLNKPSKVDLNNLYENLHFKKYYVTLRQLIENGITLVKNDGDILPLMGLDTLRIASIAIGEKEQNNFQQTMGLYSKMDFYQISKDPSDEEKNKILSALSKYNLVILSVHNTNEYANKNFGVTDNAIRFMEDVSTQKKVVLDLFANPYVLNKFTQVQNFSSIVISYENTPLVQDYSAQIIYGGIAAKGRLPISTTFFKSGTGFDTPEPTRFKYTIPEEMQIASADLDSIDKIVQMSIEDQVFPGCQIFVAKEGKVIYNKSFGYQTYDKKIPVKNQDLYDIASVTKISASLLAIMKLQDMGMLKLDGTLKDYIPEMVKNTEYANLSLREILAHQAGLVSWIPFYKNTFSKGNELSENYYQKTYSDSFNIRVAENLYIRSGYVDTIYKKIVTTKLESKEYRYSDLGYYLIKACIEKQTGIALNEFLEKNFYSKMGLVTTGYLPRNYFPLSQIVPTEQDKEFRKQLIHGDVHDPGAAMMGGISGHAGIFSNANDLAKIMQMYLKDGTYGGEKYIEETTVKEFAKCQYCATNRRGAGFDKPSTHGSPGPTCDCVSFDSFGHSGFTGTLVWADPVEKVVYVFLSNRINPSADNKKLVSQNTRSKIMRVIFDSIKKAKH